MNLSECHAFTRQARAGREPNIHKASFIKRRLFYLSYYLLDRDKNALATLAPHTSAGVTIKKGMQCE